MYMLSPETFTDSFSRLVLYWIQGEVEWSINRIVCCLIWKEEILNDKKVRHLQSASIQKYLPRMPDLPSSFDKFGWNPVLKGGVNMRKGIVADNLQKKVFISCSCHSLKAIEAKFNFLASCPITQCALSGQVDGILLTLAHVEYWKFLNLLPSFFNKNYVNW